MNVLDKTDFVNIQKSMDFIPHTQNIGWLEYTIYKRNKSILFFVNDLEQSKICCWGEVYKFPLIGKILRIEGEAMIESIQENDIKVFFEQIVEYTRKEHFAFTRISSNHFYKFEYETGIRQAGFIRPMALSLCPLTIVINTESERKPKKSWHYQYTQAKKQDYKFQAVDKVEEKDLAIFVKMYAEMAKLKGLAAVPDINSLKYLLKDSHYHLFFLYSSEGEALAAHLDYAHTNKGFHIMSANSQKARGMRGVTQFLMEQVFIWMKEHKVKYYDLGRIGPSTHNSNNVYQFKRYSGGEFMQYNGEFICVHKKWTEILYAIYLNYKIIRF